MSTAALLPITERQFIGATPVLTVTPEELFDQLLADASRLYSDVRDLRDAPLTELWRLARDLVAAIEKWQGQITGLTGADKMALAVDVAWSFIAKRGGLEALRERLTELLPVIPRFIGRPLINRLINEKNARALIRFVLELAVIELKKLHRTEA